MWKWRKSSPVNIIGFNLWDDLIRITNEPIGRSTEEDIRTLGRGDYFGEQSLIKEDRRSANIIAMSPGVECLTLDREAFKQHIGDLEELHEKDYGDNDRIYKIRQIENRQIQLLDHEKEIERGKWSFMIN